jgi:GTPase SAR1 family protein
MTTQDSADSGRDATAGQVSALCETIATAVAAYGDPQSRDQAAAAIREGAARIAEGAATAVVVGEKKRGKSSMINALIEWPDLLPVDADVATSVHISVGFSAQAGALVFISGAESGQPIGLSEIAAFAALDPETGEPTRDDVDFVTVTVPAPILESGLELIDTPGVGGLVAGHTRITRAILSRADLLFFVASASNELTQSELDFLVEATGRVATVFFVLTKTDVFPGWQQILAKNAELLAKYAPQYSAAPWFPVSSRAADEAVRAAIAGNADLAARRREQGGYDPVRKTLASGIVGQAWLLRVRNALHLACSEAEALVKDWERRLRALNLDPRLEKELIDREDRLRKLQDSDAKWRHVLAQNLRDLERDLRLTVQRAANDIRSLADVKIAEAAKADALVDLDADIEAAVRGAWLEIENSTRSGMARVVNEVSAEIGKLDLQAAASLTLPARIRTLPTMTRSATDATGWLAAVERAAPSWGMSAAAGSVAAILTGGTAVPIIIGVGTLAVLSNRRKRREALTRVRGDATRYVSRVIAEMNTEVPPQISTAVEDTSRKLNEAISDHVAQQRQSLEAERAQLRSSFKLAKEQLAKDREAARLRLNELRGLLDKTINLEQRISTEHPGA